MKTKFLKRENLYSFDGKDYKYTRIIPLSSQRYIVADDENKYGLIDNKENIIIPCKYYYGFGGFGRLLFFENNYIYSLNNGRSFNSYDIGYLYDLNGNILDECKLADKDHTALERTIIRVVNNEREPSKILYGLYNTKGKKIADIKYNIIYILPNDEYRDFYIGWIEERDKEDKTYYDYINQKGDIKTFCISNKQGFKLFISDLVQCEFYKDYVIAIFDDGYDYTDKGKYCEVKYHRPYKKYIINAEGILTKIDDYKLSTTGIEYLIDNEWKKIY